MKDAWLMKNDFQPIVGHKFSFRSTPLQHWNGVIDCGVPVIEPNSLLSYSWGSMGLKTVFAWTLAATSGGTHVRMEQSGFGSKKTPAIRARTTAGRSSSASWRAWWQRLINGCVSS